MTIRRVNATGCLAVLIVFSLVGEDNLSAVEPAAKLPFTVSKETTRITAPLRKDGYVDYLAAINALSSRGVTAENNAFVPLYQLVYSDVREVTEQGSPAHAWFYQELGIAPLKEEGVRFRDMYWYTNQAVGRKEKLELDKKTGSYDLPPRLNLIANSIEKRLEEQLEEVLRRPWTRREFPLLASWLGVNKQVLQRVRQATQRPRFYCPLVGSEDDSFSVMNSAFAGISEMRWLAKAASARVTLQLGEGQIDEAILDSLACHRLGRLVSQTPMTISVMIGNQIDAMACQADMLIAHHEKLSLEQISTWRQQLRRLPPLPKMVDRLEVSERYAFLDGALSVAQYGPIAIDSLLAGSGGVKERLNNNPLYRTLLAQFNRVVDWDEVMREGNQRYDQLVAAGRKPTCQERLQAIDEWNERFTTLKKSKLKLDAASIQAAQDDKQRQAAVTQLITDTLARLFLSSSTSRVIANDDLALMKNYLVGLSLSLAHYRLERGSYPERLSELVPRYIGQVPDDFFVGKPLRYERKGEGYLLYSLGPNRTDEQGKPFSDIVFRVPLPSLE